MKSLLTAHAIDILGAAKKMKVAVKGGAAVDPESGAQPH